MLCAMLLVGTFSLLAIREAKQDEATLRATIKQEILVAQRTATWQEINTDVEWIKAALKRIEAKVE